MIFNNTIAAVAILFAQAAFAEEIKFNKKNIKVSGIEITVEIADTDLKRSRGLMFRKNLGKNKGMLFVFDDERTRSFWMKNTFIPLSIGFFNVDKKLVDVQEMTAVESEMVQDPPSYSSSGPAKYALEMEKGWFSKNKIQIGSKFEWAEKH